MDFKEALEALYGIGWSGRAPATLRGQAAIDHEFAFALWPPGSDPKQERPFLVADVYTSERKVDFNTVLAFQAKTMDVASKEKVLIAMPMLDERAHVLARSYNMEVVEAGTASELSEKTRKLLLQIAQKREREHLRAEAEALEGVLKELEKLA